MPRARLIAGSAAIVAALGVAGALLVVSTDRDGDDRPRSRIVVCTPMNGRTLPEISGYDAEQVGNAAWIVTTGVTLDVPKRGQVIAVATALQESSLRILEHGDAAGPDSRGLFQQRDSWGTLEARLDPIRSSQLFYEQLLQVPDWQTRPLTEVAQAVQFSAYPTAYAKREGSATRIVDAVGDLRCRQP